MKQLIIGIVLAIFLFGCGESEGEKRKEIKETVATTRQAQLSVKQAEMNQREVVAEALRYMEKVEPIAAEIFSEQGTCLFMDSTLALRLEKTMNSYFPKMRYLRFFLIGPDCSIGVTFQDLAFAPDLKDKILILKIVQEKEKITWTCSLISKNKDDAPKACQ